VSRTTGDRDVASLLAQALGGIVVVLDYTKCHPLVVCAKPPVQLRLVAFRCVKYNVEQPAPRRFHDVYVFDLEPYALMQWSAPQKENIAVDDWVPEEVQDLGDYRPPIIISTKWKAAFWDLTKQVPEIRNSLLDRIGLLETPGSMFRE